MRCEIVFTDGLRNSNFVCPNCEASVTVGAAPQYLTDNVFDCTSCHQPLRCLEYEHVYVVVSVPASIPIGIVTGSPVIDDRVYYDDGR